MAFGVRAYWSQETNNSIVDRIEIQEDGYEGSAIQLEANSEGFRYRLSEITSESDDGLINPLANKIQVGKLTFFPKIVTTAEETLLDDILGSPDNTFRIVWKQDGSVNWTGYVDNKKRSYPETGGLKFTEIRANDFDLLKTIDFPLEDNRQTLITTIADLLSYLGFGYNIRTATSWITEDTTDSTDFLSQIYHETKALRVLPKTGDESPRPISVWDALVKVGDPVLLFRQVNGEFTVEQLSEFADPANVNETVYDSAGVVDTATTTVDRRLNGFTSADAGNLVVKRTSQNDLYPAIKRATVTFDHRTKVSGIELPTSITLVDATTETFSQLFIGDGTQTISLSFDVFAETAIDQSSMNARFRIKIGTYWLQDDGSWTTDTNNFYEVSLTKGKPLVGGGNVWRGSFGILTDEIPDAADGTFELVYAGASGDVDFADETLYTSLGFSINDPVADQSSTSITYQLTQANGYSTNFVLDNSWFGDGPTGYSLSALRFGSGDAQLTADSWERRGGTDYKNFHENVLKEVMDLQRSNVRKLNAEFWGQYDPSKILVYDGNNYYCAGVSYVGNLGRWSANLFKINIESATDTFEDVINFGTSVSVGNSVTLPGEVSSNTKFANSQKITETTAELSGTITSIPIEAVGEQFLEPGDIFYLFNLSTASLTEFTLANPQLGGDTSLSVESTALSETIVSGSWVVFTGDQIGSYRTQSDTAIRLGVRDYSQAITPQNDAYMMTVQTDELQSGDSLTASDITDSGFTVNFSEPDFQTADVPWAFATNGDQTALDQGLSSEIALLAGQIIIKTTGSGLAEVRLDSKASTGSLVQITADNIDLRGLVTAINDDPNSFTEIDGGKIKATSSIVVGTGENIAGLSGEGDIRLYIGGSDPETAPIRAYQNGTLEATKVVLLEGDTGGVFKDFQIRDLEITGALTIGTDGVISNDNDFRISNDGMAIKERIVSPSVKRALSFSSSSDFDDIQGEIHFSTIVGTDIGLHVDAIDDDLMLGFNTNTLGMVGILDTSTTVNSESGLLTVRVNDGTLRYIKLYET